MQISMNSGTSLQRTPWGQDKVVVIDRFKTRLNVYMAFLSPGTNRSGCCREVTVSEGSTVKYFLQANT